MKKLLFLLLPLVVFSCKDYDAQFDELSRMISALEADNRQLESQLSAIQAQDALIAQATSARLTEFATAVSQALADIGTGVTQVGAGVAGSVQMLQGIIASLTQLASAIAADAVTTAEINAQLDALEKLLEEVNQNLEDHMTHTSGGSHTSGGN